MIVNADEAAPRLIDYFFGLAECLQAKRLKRVSQLAKGATVELIAHLANTFEYTTG